MRFGETDTDAIFKRYIEPTVLSLGLNPIRIDKLEHNKNIDEKIIADLNNADIAIVDLTYARPSVYYEAGYAERKVPVIYTCRRDHFSNLDDQLRVHFDLEHKNIIDWLDVADTKFSERLERLITHVLELMLRSTLSALEDFLVSLRSSLSNPDHIFNRIRSFGELSLPERPSDPTDKLYEDKIEKRAEFYKKCFELMKKEAMDTRTSEHLIRELFSALTAETDYIKDQYAKARYGHKIFLARILKNLFAVYLAICQELHQRPSIRYEEIFTAICSDVEILIRFLRA
jgi:nucleoside 2-deoxyribosyltransferase